MGSRVPAGAWGTIALTLVGLGVPLALGSPAVGFILIALGVVAGGLTLRAWLSPSATSTQEAHATLDEALSAREERLNKALREALSLRDRAASYPNEKPPFQQDPLWRWTQRTYELICEHHPAYADDFYGPDATIDPGDLFIAFCYETQNHGRNRYLDQRIALLKTIMADDA